MKIQIWDLDQTVINTLHRYATLPNGDIDLPHWRTNCIPEKIALDSLLPLVSLMREGYNTRDVLTIICTSRVMSIWDWKYLNDNTVPYHLALYRPSDSTEPDALLKRRQLVDVFNQLKMSPQHPIDHIELWDDNPTILTMGKELGFTCWNSIEVNARMSA